MPTAAAAAAATGAHLGPMYHPAPSAPGAPTTVHPGIDHPVGDGSPHPSQVFDAMIVGLHAVTAGAAGSAADFVAEENGYINFASAPAMPQLNWAHPKDRPCRKPPGNLLDAFAMRYGPDYSLEMNMRPYRQSASLMCSHEDAASYLNAAEAFLKKRRGRARRTARGARARPPPPRAGGEGAGASRRHNHTDIALYTSSIFADVMNNQKGWVKCMCTECHLPTFVRFDNFSLIAKWLRLGTEQNHLMLKVCNKQTNALANLATHNTGQDAQHLSSYGGVHYTATMRVLVGPIPPPVPIPPPPPPGVEPPPPRCPTPTHADSCPDSSYSSDGTTH
eukprot:gene7177-11299_t